MSKKLTHLESVIILTEAADNLKIDRNISFKGEHGLVFKEALQLAYEHGLNTAKDTKDGDGD
jgi:hypothetical protein